MPTVDRRSAAALASSAEELAPLPALLGPDGRPRPVAGPGSRALARVAEQLELDVDEVAVRFLETVRRELRSPGFISAPELNAAYLRGTAATLRDMLARLRTGSEPSPSALCPDEAHLARLWAQAGEDLHALIRVCHGALVMLWTEIWSASRTAIPSADERWTALEEALTRLLAYRVKAAHLIQTEYDAEIARIENTSASSHDRTDLVLRLLRGQDVASADIGHDLELEHLALVAVGPGALETVRALAGRLERKLLVIEAPDRALWGWISGSDGLGAAAVSDLVSWQRQHTASVFFGEPASGPDGFRLSHRQALTALRVATAADMHVARYDDVALVAMARPEDACAFVEHELGPLCGDDDRCGSLRRTLDAYLRHGQSATATASVLRRNRHTVSNQLDTIREQLRYSNLEERAGELHLALRLYEFGYRP
jgi:hypothetical protein